MSMNEKSEQNPELRAIFEEVEDLSNFKDEWSHVIDPVLEQYSVSREEKILVIDELYKNYEEYEEVDVTPEDVVNAIRFVRTATNDLH